MATKNEMPSAKFEHELVAGNLTAAAKAAGAEAGKIYMVPPANIRRLDGFNVRVKTPDYVEHRNGIAKSIRANGFYPNKPLGGYVAKEGTENVFYLTDGYTRLDAVDSLNDEEFGDGGEKIEAVPFMVKPAGQNLEDLTVALVQDNEGRPLSVFERALVVARLKSYNMDNAVIATRLNITPRYVDDLLMLAGAPASVRNLLIKGAISATEAVKQLRKEGSKAGKKLEAAVETATKAGKKKATGKDVKKAAGEPTRKETKKAKQSPSIGAGAPPEALPGKKTETFSFVFTQGQIVTPDDVKPVARVLDGSWWNYSDETKSEVLIEEDIEISMTVITTAPAAADDDIFGDAPETSQEGAEGSEATDAPEEGAAADVTQLGAPVEPDTGDL